LFDILVEVVGASHAANLVVEILLHPERIAHDGIGVGRRPPPQIMRRNKPKLGFHVKNYQERYIPLTADVCEALLLLRAAKSPLTEFVFHKSNGDRWQDLSERENLASAVRTLEGFVTKSVTTLRETDEVVRTGRMAESEQVHAMLQVPAALLTDAGVVKLADARDSKSRGAYTP
jgi:hypothetical protein